MINKFDVFQTVYINNQYYLIMETKTQYRRLVDKKTAKDFQDSLEKAISQKKPKNIGFIGLVHDYDKKDHHDIDVLLFPSPNAKIGEALIEITELYDQVEKDLQKKNKRYYLVTCPLLTMQQMVYYLASIQEGSAGMIPIHSLFFPDYKSFKERPPKRFETAIKKNLVPIFGEYDVFKKLKNDIPQEMLEPYFFILNFELSARIKTFPRHNVRASAEHLFEYLRSKYNLQITSETPHSIKDIKKEFIKLMKKLDGITYA